MNVQLRTAALVGALSLTLVSNVAEACGCFAPPDPTVPVVQAGERILFAVQNGVVTAHIQIQYAGDAKDFGWLLPLPSVPTLKLGTEELFTQLIRTTQPRYFVRNTFTGNCGGLRSPSANAGFSESDSVDAGSSSPLVTESSIGPYHYAVLKADSKEEMFKWLTDNHYFIPTGTDETVGPYINPGAYFLALKLKSGKSAGDIQPVVLSYASELPMIPIILTSVAAVPNMGVQVWMLGSSRAIPRNYNHVVLNDAQIDWLGQARNYNEVVIRAISETPEKHAFITEYAGTSAIMRDVLDPAGRFGSSAELAALTDPAQFVQYLFAKGFPTGNNSGRFGPSLPPLVKNLVLAMVPVPAKLVGVSEDAWLQNLSFYLGEYRAAHPEVFAGWSSAFDAPALAAQLDEKVVRPAREAGELFRRYSKLTRLYTALSPQDMTRDPVFSFNPSLPDVSRDHSAELRTDCNLFTGSQNAPRTLITEQGFAFRLTDVPRDLTLGPGAMRIETLGEEGPAKVLVDNRAAISQPVGCGCASVDALSLGALGLLAASLRRRRTSP